MRALAQVGRQWSDGERQIGLAYVLLGLTGAGLAFTVALRIGRSDLLGRGPGLYDGWILIAGAVGALITLWQASGWFGHPGTAGLRRACIGSLVVSFVAPIIAGTLILPLYGTMFGPFALAVTLASSPFVAGVWLATLGGTHLLFLSYRAERETIFVARPRVEMGRGAGIRPGAMQPRR